MALEPPPSKGFVLAYDTAQRSIILFGGWSYADTWTYRLDSAAADDLCDGSDGDGDGLVDCADQDCWGACAPLCGLAGDGADRGLIDPDSGHCLARFGWTETWADAEAACAAHGGHLATIGSVTENARIQSLGAPGWIGLNDRVAEGSFLWSSGDAASYTGWASGQPDDDDGADCALAAEGGWTDEPCADGHSFVCEIEI
jgi:hypothetical protein